jgi:hypothetical protein
MIKITYRQHSRLPISAITNTPLYCQTQLPPSSTGFQRETSNSVIETCFRKNVGFHIFFFCMTKFQVKIKSQILKYTDASFTKLAVELCYILIIFTKLELFVAF